MVAMEPPRRQNNREERPPNRPRPLCPYDGRVSRDAVQPGAARRGPVPPRRRARRKLMNNKVAHSGGIGCTTVLTIVFTALKLTGHISWSWWWVLAPTWIPILIVAPVLVVVFMASR